MKLVLLQSKGMLYVGRLADASIALVMSCPTLDLQSPRMIFRDSSNPEEESIVLQHLPTNPDVVTFTTASIDHIFESNDSRFDAYYVEQTTNLKLM